MLYRYKEETIFLCSLSNVFQVVIDIEKYPDFIPWCKAAYIKKNHGKMVVDLLAAFYGIKGSYTSEVTFLSPGKGNESWIKAISLSGVFKCLYNEWRFIFIDKNKTVVKFYIEFEFKSRLLSSLLDSVCKYAQREIIGAFKDRIENFSDSKLS
ncbi:type II toxin-antitoxin system RatA family toxin [Wolbachia endosymbiont of Cruorifilaria tuberocauda]|nr:type II toxin-antitoxin system RatA family toxin [Wolbachia endosymbiont of Cruorifilaria tuberocauda]